MTYCPNCGAVVDGRFCAKCGSAAGPEPGGTAPPPAPPAAQSGLADNVACALCYLLLVLTGVLFLVLAPYNQNKTIRFHAFQSIFLWVAVAACGIAVTMLNVVLVQIPFIGFLVVSLLYFGLSLGAFILWLMLMYKAYNHERWVLPVIGPLAEKQA